MLAGLVAWVLNNYLGKYVENLNTDQLSIALLSGEVELENLPLKKDAFRHLGLPIEVKAGFIGKVKLQIPVRQIRSAPWVIVIEQLYVVASPLPVVEWDAIAEELSAQERKMSQLDNLEVRWRLENSNKENNATYYSSTYSSWLNYGTGLITNIIENLQLKIRDVHFRYEDNVSIPNKAVALGVTVEALSAQSCNENWIPGFSHWDSSASSFKLLELQKLAIYCIDLEYDKLFMKLGLGEIAVAMSPGQYSRHNQYYILAPVSAQAKVKRNRSEKPLRSNDTPRIVCDLQLDEVPMTLDNCQHDRMVKCIKGLDDVARFRSYRYYRPSCSVRQDPRAWWLYAISCLYPGKQPAICRPRPTWESCFQHANENVQYVRIYTKLLTSPNVALVPEDKKLKDQIEWSRTFDELKILRELSMRSVPLQNQPAAGNGSAGRGLLVRWFPQWIGWYNSSTIPESNTETTQLEGEILQALSDTLEDNTLLRRDVVFGQFSFTLKSGLLNLSTVDDNSKERIPMIEFEFKNVCLNVTSRPRSSSHTIELSLGAIYLKDKITPNTIFPVLVGPPGHDRTSVIRSRGPSPRVSVASKPEDLFSLVYEKCTANLGCDYRLTVRSKCLDVVYQPAAIKWLIEFILLPYQRVITHSSIEAMKTRTKKGLIKNWEQMLDGRVTARKIWEIDLDISAPQIFFVEKFHDQNSCMAVLDFGRFQISNSPSERVEIIAVPEDISNKTIDDDELFVTPCSTPPVSEESNSDSPLTAMNVGQQINESLTEGNLHDKLYDRYNVELTDMQVLVGKVKDNWRYAHNKGTSTMHVLDRFNISLKIERRIVHTTDPLYPSLTVNANLPKLVAHFNESKITSARTLMQIISSTGLPSPFNAGESLPEDLIVESLDEDDSTSVDTSIEMSRLMMLQFTVDHLAMEVQSRGRSVAELQVSGVKIAFTKRPIDTSITLTVHSLLLVDALQTFGPDFELLVASHKHVGMDSMSGSLRDSEPTSPISPGSPDPTIPRPQATSPVALKQALTSLAASPPLHQFYRGAYNREPCILDAEALISIEVILVAGPEPMQLANIQFNNLDIIANQETIVELMGFIRRVFPDMKSHHQPPLKLQQTTAPSSVMNSTDSLDQVDSPKIGTTELTFDFHRLNVLLLRGVVKDGSVQGRKICTATMSEAKIQATVDTSIVVEGSLGGLQVLDLTPEGHMHQRIISVGKDPLLDMTHPLYVMSQNLPDDDAKAFSFKFLRSLNSNDTNDDDDQAEIIVRMASLWYTHSSQFVAELESCATEFKQYMANLARSIRSAATDMALGLVHARLSASIYGSALSFSDIASPRRRRRSSSMDQTFSGYSSARETIPQTPYSPEEYTEYMINIKLDVVLDSPVVILPRTSNNAQVFLGHLGKITLTNNKKCSLEEVDAEDSKIENYDIEVKDMNIFSLDTSSRRVPGPLMSRPEIVYNCDTLAKPILHDTILQLNIVREIYKTPSSSTSVSNILLDGSGSSDNNNEENKAFENIQVTGSVVTALKVSLARYQYEQLIDTVSWLMSTPSVVTSHDNTNAPLRPTTTLTDISEEDTGVPTLKMDPHVRAKLFPGVTGTKQQQEKKRLQAIKVLFELPNFIVELRGDSPMGEQGLVDLSFRDFCFIYEKCHQYETNVQVSLRSILMEDLLQPEGAKQRAMVVSSCDDELPPGSSCISRSCPNMSDNLYMSNIARGSLPTNLEPAKLLLGVERKTVDMCNPADNLDYPCTPPPSPTGRKRAQKNLVLISTLIVDPKAPNFRSHYKAVERSTSVDFNCLDLVVNVESWVLVIDFFSVVPSPTTRDSKPVVERQYSHDILEDRSQFSSETNVSVRSLTMVLVRPDRDLAKANISRLNLSIKSNKLRNETKGELGSMSLVDLTPHGQLYRERFLMSGKQALNFSYYSFGPNKPKEYDAQLKLEMASVLYVHTKRFVAEIIAFFNHFTQLQAVMTSIRAATSGQKMKDSTFRLSLVIEAASPVILLPVSSKSTDLLICDLGQLSITNKFQYNNDVGTISVEIDKPTAKKCLLDVMHLELQNVDLYAGTRVADTGYSKTKRASGSYDMFRLGLCIVKKNGTSILTEPCHLKLQVERNLDAAICHNVPDMSIHGELSTLEGSLNESQYRLIRGLLAHNIGENTQHILPLVQPPPVSAEPNIHDVWTINSIRLDLLNVIIRLNNSAPLACINFIKSRLIIETFSNFCQDVDLVSQEILIRDTRFEDAPANKRSNAFTDILEPLRGTNKERSTVQVEIHSRKRHDRSKSTILLNNMRLMAVFDWWEAAREFIFQKIDDVTRSPTHDTAIIKNSKPEEDVNYEFKLNVTDSELVVFEDTSQWDTNAVILKSTTVISYKPFMTEKPMSCNLNNCEMYSCILGMEDETASSIIDPVTLNIDINRDKVLEVLLQRLIIRVSYFDMKMFLQILNSLPKQMLSGKKEEEPFPANLKNQIDKLTALGFTTGDCLFALERNNRKLDDAALWLTQNAIPRSSSQHQVESIAHQSLDLSAIEVKADCISLNIIDDCGDVDVPLLELSLSHLNLRQCLTPLANNEAGNASQGALECTLTSDYYNRVLSGWEPVVEPWKCFLIWNHSLTSNLSRNRLQMRIESTELLNVNVTSTLIELYKLVRDNWTQDFYSSNRDSASGSSRGQSSSSGYRRRSPFVPFAIKNETGSLLKFTTITSELDELYEYKSTKKAHKWHTVEHGNTVPFSFKTRGKLRHSDSHKMRMHRLGVQIEGYETVTLVTIDKVGVYFRNALPSVQNKKQQDLPPVRVVFDVALEGSARKLVTVRSALMIVNKLRDDVEIKLESRGRSPQANQWGGPGENFIIKSNDALPVPLIYAHYTISARPINQIYTFSQQIQWERVAKPGEMMYELKSCYANRGQVYRFCSVSKRELYPHDRPITVQGVTGHFVQPGHTVTLFPTVLIVNLLPVDLTFKITGGSGRVHAGSNAPITFVDAEQDLELKLQLENYSSSSIIRVPINCLRTTFRLKLEDNLRRKLNLTINVSPHSEAKLKITVSAPYWIINKTGLPLVFKQGGVASEASGQFTEHESARMVAPLLFSFSDPDASPTVVARVGSNVITDGVPQWCHNFHLQRGCQVGQLKISLKDGRPDIVFLIGIEVRNGRGKYRDTNIVIISPRFQLHNKTSYQLLFAQSCGKRDMSDPKVSRPLKTYLKAMPDCHMPFHWTHFDQEQLLCVLILDIPDCWWSGGLKIDRTDSMHVNIRDANGRMYFLRLEIVLQGATYFVVFTDADTMPPPLRVDNFSEVSIIFSQTCCKDIVHSIARAHSSVPYAWDKPMKPQMITLEAPGGVIHSYDMRQFGPGRGLTYENFIYIAFSGTFKKSPGNSDIYDVESQELVLDVVNKTQVVLARKQPGQRSQLWRMSTTGQLQHEGSSPPSYPQQPKSENVYVLDIEGFAPQPSSYTRLCLRRPDPRRKSTQTWRFTEEGRLCCVHNNMCVQAQDGFYGLRQGSPVACWQQWNAAVLGLPQPICHRTNESGIPLEQAVSRQRLRPGSGFLDVDISTDGPTRVISIWDKKDKNRKYAMSDEKDWVNIVPKQRPCLLKGHEETDRKERKEYQFTLKLKGLGVSVIAKNPSQELLFAYFCNINGETLLTSASNRFCISVGDIQIDNQLFDSPTPIFLHVTRPSSRNTKDAQESMPALDISAELQPVLNENAVIFKYFIMTLKKLTVYLEERLLLKLFCFIGFNSQEEILYNTDENDYEAQRVLIDLSAAHARRYYFGLIQLQPSQIRLSMKTASKLSSQSTMIKKKLGFTFIKFEDAAIDLEPFRREHPFETLQFLIHSIIKHFRDELKWQAAVILGSVDFLGNPLGFMNDVSEGVNGLLREGNVGGLVTNLAHGLSNSAAKVTETISDGLGLVTMDDEHEEMRQKIRQEGSGRSRDHLYAGLKGLGFGVLGGATGIFKQVYEGATNEGIQGVFSGIGKGLVGAVAKPVVGVLDLASETARAVRDSSRGSSRKLPDKIRPARCVFGIGDLLPRYSLKQALGQQYLHTLNDKNYGEQLVAYENLRLDYDDLHIIISNQRIRIVTNLNGPNLTTIIVCHLSDLEKCRTVTEENRHYIEITMHVQSTSTALVYQDPVKKPRVRCESHELATTVLQQLNYAKRLYDERLHTLNTDNMNCED